MEKELKDVKIGDKIQPFISERSMKRVKTQFTVIDEPEWQKGSFSHFVLVKCIDSKGNPYEIFLQGDIIVVVD